MRNVYRARKRHVLYRSGANKMALNNDERIPEFLIFVKNRQINYFTGQEPVCQEQFAALHCVSLSAVIQVFKSLQ